MAGLTHLYDDGSSTGVYMTPDGEVVTMPHGQAAFYNPSEVAPGMEDQLGTPGEGPVPQDVLDAVASQPPQAPAAGQQQLPQDSYAPEVPEAASPPEQPALPQQVPPQQSAVPVGSPTDSTHSQGQRVSYSHNTAGPVSQGYSSDEVPDIQPIRDEVVSSQLQDTQAVNNALGDAEAEKLAYYDAARHDRELEDQRQFEVGQFENQRRDAEDKAYNDAQSAAAKRWEAIKQVAPKDLWADRTGFQKTVDAAGAMIGGLLQAYHGGRNTYMDWLTEQINKDIDRDMASQQANVENQKAAAYRADRQVGDLRDLQRTARYDRRQAELDRRAAFDTHLEGLAQQFQSKAMRANTLQLQQANRDAARKTVLEMAKDKAKDAWDRVTFDEQVRQNREAEKTRRSQVSLGWANQKLDRDKFDYAKTRDVGAGGVNPELLVYDPVTRKPVGYMQTKEKATKAQEMLNGASSADKKLQELIKRQPRVGGQLVPWNRLANAEQKEFNALYTDYLSERIMAMSGKASTPEEVERLKQSIPITLLFGEDATPTQENFRRRRADEVNLNLGALQPLPGQEAPYDFGSTSARLGQSLGTGDEPAPATWNETQLGYKAARNLQERAEYGRAIIEQAWKEKDTDSGRARIRKFADEIEKSGDSALIPDANNPGGMTNLADLVRGTAYYGEMNEKGRKIRYTEDELDTYRRQK